MTRRPRPFNTMRQRAIRRPAVAPRRTLSCGGATPERRCSSFSCSSPPCSCCTASSGRRSLPPTSQRSSRGCSTAGGSSSRCSRRGTSSAPGARSSSSATPAAACWTPSRRWPRWLRVKWIGIALFVAVLFTYELFDLWALAPRDRLARARLLRRRAGDRSSVHRRDLLQVPLPDRSVQLRGVDDVAARTAGAAARRPAGRAGPWTASRAAATRPCRLGSCAAAASWRSFFRPRSATSIARSASTACRRARTTTSRSRRVCRARAGRYPRRRSGIGWLSRRRDVAALALVFVFGGLINALGMTAPARAMEQGLVQILGARIGGPGAGGAVRDRARRHAARAHESRGGAHGLAHRRPHVVRRWTSSTRLFVCAVPLGFGVWLAHYGFHLLTGSSRSFP